MEAEHSYQEQQLDGALRCYLMLLLHRFAPDGVSFTESEAKIILSNPHTHLMIHQQGDTTTFRLLTSEERELVLSQPAGSC